MYTCSKFDCDPPAASRVCITDATLWPTAPQFIGLPALTVEQNLTAFLKTQSQWQHNKKKGFQYEIYPFLRPLEK